MSFWFGLEDYMNDIEFSSAAEIKAFQEDLLHKHLVYLKKNSPYYRRVFDSYGININKIVHLEDLTRIPFTEKKDLQLYNDDFCCVPKNKIIDYITTSGTLGDPVLFGCTEKDLQRLAYNEKKSFTCAGLTADSVVQLMTTLDKRFMAGMAYFLGLREMGAGVIRVGNGIPELQWDTIRRFHPDAILNLTCWAVRSTRNGLRFNSLPHIHRPRWVPLSASASTAWAVMCIRSLSSLR